LTLSVRKIAPQRLNICFPSDHNPLPRRQTRNHCRLCLASTTKITGFLFHS
jgi:hypothetical protein